MTEVENIADWRGKEIVDRNGEKIGKLEDVYIDAETDEPMFGAVKEGMIAKHLTFVPLTEATVSPEGLKVAVTKKQVKDAPSIDQGAELSASEESDLYRHYELRYEPTAAPSGRRLAKR